MTGNSVLAGTNIFIDLMKGDAAVAARLQSFDVVYLSPIIIAQLSFGAYRSADHQDISAALLSPLKIPGIDASTTEMFVSIKLILFTNG